MKKSFGAATLLLLVIAMPSQAEIVRRPLFQRPIWQSPIVHQLLNFPISQFVPGFPDLGALLGAKNGAGAKEGTTGRIDVGEDVINNLAAIKTNLDDARARTNKLLIDNNLKVEEKKGPAIKTKDS